MKFLLKFLCFFHFSSGFLHGMHPVQSKLEPNWGTIPADVRNIIQSYLLSSIVADSLKQTVKNISHFARVNKSFRNFLNEPQNLMYVIQMMADRIKRMDENSVAQGLKNMPGMQSSEVKQWLEKKKAERQRDGNLIYEIQNRASGANIEKILAEGANPDYKSKSHKEPALVLAAQMNNLEAVQALLKAGAQVNNTDLKLRTALNEAVSHQNLAMLQELLKYHANVNAQDDNGDTALMGIVRAAIWAHESNIPIIQALLNAGADLTIRNKQGKTTLDLVHNDEIKTLLLIEKKN